MSSKCVVCIALACAVFFWGMNPCINTVRAQPGSYAQTGAYQFNPFSSDYVKDPTLPDFLNPFVPNDSGTADETASFSNAAILNLPDVDAWGMGDAYGEIAESGISKSVEANRGYKKNGNYFAFARSSVRGTTFQVQGTECNDFNGDGLCDVIVSIVIPSTSEAPPLRATQLPKAPDATILLPEPQQLVVDDPLNLLGVEGCEFAADPAACQQNGAAQAFDLSLRMEGFIDVPSAGILESIFGQVTLGGNGELSFEQRQGGNIFLDQEVFRGVVPDRAVPGRVSTTVEEQVVVREFLVNTDPDNGLLSDPITIDLELTLNGPPIPGVPAEAFDPDQPIEDFFDPHADPLDIPYYAIFGIDESDPSRARAPPAILTYS